MDDNQIKQTRKIIFHHLKIAKEKVETASFILERKEGADAIPILFKALDIAIRVLLNFKQKPLAGFQKNSASLEKEYQKEGLGDEETMKLCNSLYEMDKKYRNEVEVEVDEREINNVLEKVKNFLDRAYKFLKTQLTNSREMVLKRAAKRILRVSLISIASLVVIFLLVKLGQNIFGPKHGLLARYYNNISLQGPPALEKIDKKIDFRWGPLRPNEKISSEFYSVRWEGRIKIDKNDKYTFYINSDEGVRLFIDDKIIIDTWLSENRMMENSGEVTLKKGFHKIRLDYYFNQRFADIELLWSSKSFKKRSVSSKFLFPPLSINVSR